ncbi:formate dehydrogenase subunit delta [Marinobacterium sp. D7]|uniref:formate dehydrogenase subunit delta n=1 Tax=Marinobacterium ramblicola TaxID=2849041 RepID=UPI001C2D5BE2|nr:formate dehydrogenase subunit delta [Marinobacterium ramblicola]MBV1790443.1 formate dehydrogenase subunit delta [Marinobacterium ramblicola]
MFQTEQEHLIQMINQIALNNISAGDENDVADMVASHVKKFWSRRMKSQLFECVEQGGEELHPAARLAGERLQSETKPLPQ